MFTQGRQNQVFVDDGNARAVPAVRILSTARGSLLLRNTGSNDVYLGNGTETTVTLVAGPPTAVTLVSGLAVENTAANAKNGFVLKAGESMETRIDNALWGVCASGASTVVSYWTETEMHGTSLGGA